jgi:hypothetical protein
MVPTVAHPGKIVTQSRAAIALHMEDFTYVWLWLFPMTSSFDLGFLSLV